MTGEIKLDSVVDNGTHGKKTAKPLIIGIIVLAVLIVAAVIYWIVSSGSGSYVAKVGNEKVSTWEYEFYLKQVKSSILQKTNTTFNAGDTAAEQNFWKNTKYEGENALAYAKKQALDQLKSNKVELIKAKEAKTTLTSDQQKAIDELSKNMASQLGGTEKDAEKYVKDNYGLTMSQFKDLYKESTLVSVFQQNQIKNLKAEDIKTYYAKNPDTFKTADYRNNTDEAVWVRHILIKTVDDNNQPLSQDKQDAAKKKAEELLAKAKSGEDFSDLAKKNSEDTGSAQYGGDYVFSKGTGMDSEFEKASFALNAGQVSGLVKSTFGYHIIKLEEKIPQDKPVSLNCATTYREFGENRVKQAMYQDMVKKWKDAIKLDLNDKEYNKIS